MPQSQTDYTDTNHTTQEQYTPGETAGQSGPATMTKRIGSTHYRVSVHFSKTSRETISDKILRLAKNEVANQ